MAFDRTALLAMFSPKIVPVTLTVGDQSVDLFVHELSARQVFAIQSMQKKGSPLNNEEFSLFLISEALCDGDGLPVFTKDQAQEMLTMKVQAFQNMVKIVAESAGLTPANEAEKSGNA